MARVLRVVCESPTESATFYARLGDDETPETLKGYAQDIFFDWANFGYDVIDESDVPEGEEIFE